MGYRTYIGFMPKSEYNKIKSLTRIELFNAYKVKKDLDDPSDFYIGVCEFGKELYEFGKDTGFNPPKKSMKSFFKKSEVKEYYEENDFYVVDKEFLAYLINVYKEKVTDYYNAMMLPFFGKRDTIMDSEKPTTFLNSIKTIHNFPDHKYEFDFTKITPEEQTALFKIIEHVRTFRTEWTILTPFNLDKGDAITGSWKYEYAIFELVRIYKSFDWKKNVMIYYGY